LANRIIAQLRSEVDYWKGEAHRRGLEIHEMHATVLMSKIVSKLRAEIEGLKAENALLRERLRVMETAVASTGSAAPTTARS